MRTKKKPGKCPIAKERPTGEVEKTLKNIGKFIKESRQKRSSLVDFAYEINISRSALARYEADGDMLLSSCQSKSWSKEIGKVKMKILNSTSQSQ